MSLLLSPEIQAVITRGPNAAGPFPKKGFLEPLSALLRPVTNLLFPHHCMACGAALHESGNGVICCSCASKSEWIGSDCCLRCGGPSGAGQGGVAACRQCRSGLAFIEGGVAVARYAGPLRTLIKGLKFGGELRAAVLLGQLLAARIQRAAFWTLLDSKNACLMPVPLYAKDFSARGFNQAEEMGRICAHILGLRFETDALKKGRSTPPQATLDREMRRRNLSGVFEAQERILRSRPVEIAILVDDVMTTGATFTECAKVLRGAGVKQIFVAALARG